MDNNAFGKVMILLGNAWDPSYDQQDVMTKLALRPRDTMRGRYANLL
jgi:hypothetical protein